MARSSTEELVELAARGPVALITERKYHQELLKTLDGLEMIEDNGRYVLMFRRPPP